jgi:ABC-type antimicrobial peptide transport system permease subunit
LGQRITLYEEFPREIIGVVADVRDAELGSKPEPMVYVPVGQRLDADNAEDNRMASMIWAVRTKPEPYSLSASIQRELRVASGGLPVAHIRLMEQVRVEATASSNFNMMLFNIFAGIAVLLAAIGIYGVMVYAVQQRTQEIGVRMALGASPRDVLRMVVRQGMRLALIGVLIGLVGAWALTPLMASLLYGVKASDPVVLISVAVLLSAVALVASVIPARRATRVDPVLALRLE